MTEYKDGHVSLQVLSHSKVSAFRDCPSKGAYRYVDGLRSRVERDPTKIRGRTLHEGLRAGFTAWAHLRGLGASAEDATSDLLAAAQVGARDAYEAELSELATMRQSGADPDVCDEVVEALTESFDVDRWALDHFFRRRLATDYEWKIPVIVEGRIDVPILDARGRARHLRWVGYIDAVLYNERLRILEIEDHKSVASGTGSDEHRRRIEGDPQLTSYVYAVRWMRDDPEASRFLEPVLGPLERPDPVPVGQVSINVIRRKRPAMPRILADGTVSTDRRIDTLPEFYERALYEQAAEPEYVVSARSALAQAEREGKATKALAARLLKADERWEKTQQAQADLLEEIRGRGDSFFTSIEQFITEDEIERWRREQWIEAQRIRRIEKHPAERTRNRGFCTAPGRGCSFRSLCYANDDPQVRAVEFTTPEERERLREAAEQKTTETVAESVGSWT